MVALVGSTLPIDVSPRSCSIRIRGSTPIKACPEVPGAGIPRNTITRNSGNIATM